MKNIQIIAVVFLMVITSLQGISQGRYGRSGKPQKLGKFVQSMDYQGWFFSPGITLTPKMNFFSYDPVVTFSGGGNTYEAVDLKQHMKVGAYFEVGRYNLLSTKKLISYIDYGLAYKMLRAGQTYDLTINGVESGSFEQNYISHAVLGFFNANNVLGINKNIFFQNTLGVNVDYSLSQKLETNDASEFINTYQEDPTKLRAQLHYKFGVGIRIGKQLYAIPSVEIPLLNGWQWEGGRSTFGAFNSRYRPLVISIRFAWLTIPKCPKVWDNDDSSENGGGL